MLEVEDERFDLNAETLVRVGFRHRRRVLAGPDGVRLMVIGGIPGEVYRESEFSRLGASDEAPRQSIEP